MTADQIGRLLPSLREAAEHLRSKDKMNAARLGQPVEYGRLTLTLVDVYNGLLRRYDELRAEEERDETCLSDDLR